MTETSTSTSDRCSSRRRYHKRCQPRGRTVLAVAVLSSMSCCCHLILSLLLLLSSSSSFLNNMSVGVAKGYLQRTLPSFVGHHKHSGWLVGQCRIAFSPNHNPQQEQQQQQEQQHILNQWQKHTHRSRARLYSSRSDSDYYNTNNSNINVISSPKSTTIKKVVALLKKRKKRTEFQQTVVEGPRIIFDLLENPKTFHLVRQILISSEDEDEYERDELDGNNDNTNKNKSAYESRLRTIISEMTTTTDNDESPPPPPQIQFVTPDVFYHCCSDTVTPQGIAAIVDTPNPQHIEDDGSNDSSTLESSRGGGGSVPLYLVLDALSDPGNTGTLIRSGLAAGVSGIILLPGSADVWNPKSVRSAMGASFQIPIYQPRSWDDAVELLHSKLGVKAIYAATMIDGDDDGVDSDEGGERTTSKSSIPYYDIDWTTESSALIIGSEGNGLSLDVRDALLCNEDEDADVKARMQATHIPMQPGIESLNAAVCGSVIMFEYSRQQTQQQR